MNKLFMVSASFMLSPLFVTAFAATSPAPLAWQLQHQPAGTYYFSSTSPNQPQHVLFRPAKPQFLLQLRQPALYPALAQLAQSEVQRQRKLKPTLGTASLKQLQQAQLQQLRQQPQLLQQLSDKIAEEQQQLQAALQQLGNVRVENNFHKLTNMLVVSGNVSQQQLEALPEVQAVYQEQQYKAALTKSVPQVKAPQAWKTLDKNGKNITGLGVKIAVLDTGVDFSHPALGGCFGRQCKVVAGYNTYDNNNDITDVNSHGTHVAAIAAGKAETGNGVAPDASIVAVKVLNDYGYGTDSSVIAGIEYALDPDDDPATNDGADVINISLSGPGGANSPISQAAEAAVRAGVVVVAAAGNDSDYMRVGAPAVTRSVIAVANVDQNDTVAYSSSRGPVEGADYLKPEISAPGTEIEAAKAGGGLKRLSGTSMASPHVAGAAALLLQAAPELTPAEVKQRLLQSVDLISGNPAETGSGRLNIQKALTQQFSLDKTALVLGRIPEDSAVFSGERTIKFFNPTAEAVTVSASVSRLSTAAFEVSFNASELQVPAHSSVNFIVKYQAITADVPYPENAGGVDGFHLTFSAKGQALTLPVLFEKYQAMNIQTDGNFVEMRFYDENWRERYAVSGRKEQLRLHNLAQLKYVYSWAYFADPNGSRGSYITGQMLKPVPQAAGDHTLVFNKNQFNEYYQISQVQLNGQAVDFSKSDNVLRSTALLKDGKPVLPILNAIGRGTCVGCSDRPTAFMTAGFDSSWTFQQGFQYPKINGAEFETMFFSWQAALGQGSKTTKIDVTDASLLKFELIPGRHPITASGNGYYWPSAAKAGDIMRVYQTGPLLLPDIAPQIYSYNDKWVRDSHSGYFSATAHGTVQKWLQSNSTPYLLTPVLDLQTDTVPLRSSLKSFAGALALVENRERFLLSSAPRISQFSWEREALWYDQYLNIGYLNSDIQTAQCGRTKPYFGDFVDSSPSWSATGCNELVFEVNNEAAKLLPVLPTAKFEVKADGAFPQLRFFRLYNNGKSADHVSRLDHQLSFDVRARDDIAEVSKVTVEMRTTNSDWRVIYQHNAAGLQQLKLPMQPSATPADLRVRVWQTNGNQSQQLLPAALEIGLGAGGDHDVDGDGIVNSIDADNDNDGVPDSSDMLPFDASESLDFDKDGVGNNADPDDDNDGYADTIDAFPLDATEWLDTDKDGTGNNADKDDDNDNYPDEQDAFPLDVTEWLDTDKDGIGNNADNDDDNDGTPDSSDKFPLDASRHSDVPPPANNTTGSGGGSGGGAGIGGLVLMVPLIWWQRRRNKRLHREAA